MDSHEQRLARARQSLEGLSVGDALGGRFEMASPARMKRYLEKNQMPPPRRFTDDTNMALSIYSILRQYSRIEQDALGHSFGLHFELGRGYGLGARKLLARIQGGQSWRDLASTMFGGMGSFGNGSAMRVAPVGAYFADDLPAAIENARLSAEITHAHPEGITGAIAVAIGAAIAVHFSQDDGEDVSRAEFLDTIASHIPDSDVRAGILRARDLPLDTTVDEAVTVLGNGSRVSCQDTVPFVLWCAGTHLDHYEQALTLAARGGGDVDTTCAMVGGIVVMSSGADAIPDTWLQFREPLPRWAFEEETRI